MREVIILIIAACVIAFFVLFLVTIDERDIPTDEELYEARSVAERSMEISKRATEETTEESTEATTEEPKPWEPFTYEEAVMIAQTIWGEARGVSDRENQKAVAYTILYRYATEYGGATSVAEVITAKNQFQGYNDNNPVDDDLWELTLEAISDYNNGCCLPYLYFYGAGDRNVFK